MSGTRNNFRVKCYKNNIQSLLITLQAFSSLLKNNLHSDPAQHCSLDANVFDCAYHGAHFLLSLSGHVVLAHWSCHTPSSTFLCTSFFSGNLKVKKGQHMLSPCNTYSVY